MHLWDLLVLIALSCPVSSRHVLFEEVRHPKGWTVTGKPGPGQSMEFEIALRPHQHSQKLFEQTSSAISDPNHAQYGQHLNRDQLKDLLRAPDAAIAVRGWLTSSGISEADIQGDEEWITITTTIFRAEMLLNTTFQIYRSPIDQRQVVRTLRYSVPNEIASSIDLIHPTTRFPQIRPAHNGFFHAANISSIAPMTNIPCSVGITPACLIELYHINGFNFSTNSSQTGFMGVSGYLEQYARYADLLLFQQLHYRPALGANFSWTGINGGVLDQNSLNDSSEANLDIEYSTSLTHPLPVTFYSTPGRPPYIPDLDEVFGNSNEPYLKQLTYLINQPDGELPHTLTTSYGEDEQTVPPSYSQKVCNLFGALGLRGVSVIFSSGDGGPGAACKTNDGTNRTRFTVQFPAACPYVTAVGATTSMNPETAASFSGGGFSERWPRPWWQQNQVVGYLEKLGDQKFAGLYNPWGRGVPDVAAQGTLFVVIDKGKPIIPFVNGTSCAAPTFASIIAIINALKLQSGQAPLGFLNPWLYTRAFSALNDITEGGSTGCAGIDPNNGMVVPDVPYASWNATEGWDPVTGLGTPDFQKLAEVAGANTGDIFADG